MFKPVASILMLAHNHQEFISEAIQSVVNQSCKFDFELLIGEDASTDATALICKDYQLRYPALIQVISHPTNIGMHGNFADLWEHAKGEYIGFCEGDDFWTVPDKLQKQLTFFKENADCTLCGTVTEKIELDDAGNWVITDKVNPVVVKQKYSFRDLIPGYNFHFSSVMVLKSAVKFPEWFQNIYCVDRPLYLLAAQNGKAGLIPEVTSVYRIHQGGSWSSNSMEKKAADSTHLFLTMRNYFDARYQKLFDRTLGNILWSYMADDLHNDKIESARKLYWKSIRYTPVGKIFHSVSVHIRVLLRLYFGSLHNLLKSLSGK